MRTRYTSPSEVFTASELGNLILMLANMAQRFGGDYQAGYLAALSDLSIATDTTAWVVGQQYALDALLRSSPQGRAWRQSSAPLAGVVQSPAPAGVALADVAELLMLVLARNESLAAQAGSDMELYRRGFAAAIDAIAAGFELPAGLLSESR